MRKQWGRWRGYMDELEEVMRDAGVHLEEVETLLAEIWEKDTWRSRQAGSFHAERLRRAMAVPFLADLIRTAWRVGPDGVGGPPDFEGRAWGPDEASELRASAARRSGMKIVDPAPPDLAHPPARLCAAERALADRTRSLVVVLDNLVSPRNGAAIVRTSEALGVQEVHFVQAEGPARLERTIAMHAQRWLDLFWYRETQSAIEALKTRGFRILVSDHDATAQSVSEVPLGGPVALCFGGERRGVGAALREAADGFFFVPTPGFTAYMNVSVAAGISLFEVDRRMRAEGSRAPIDETDRASLRRAWYEALAKNNPRTAARFFGWLDSPPDPAPYRRPEAGLPGAD